MDLWDFKKWRQKLGYTQSVAAEKLGLSRGAVQYWESEIRPVPVAVELACQELLRLWKQRPEFGPVTLLYADGPVSLETFASVSSIPFSPSDIQTTKVARRCAERDYDPLHRVYR
jgi:DNA-binding XRE family transcriptional regulator